MLPFISWEHIIEKTSCRRLENWWKNNDETCQFLLNCKKPSKTTINDFMNNNMNLIDEFDNFLVQFGIKTHLIEGKIIYGDGKILKGYCNSDKKMYPNQIKYLKNFIIKNYNEYKNKKSDFWNKLHKFFYNGEYQKELKEFYKQLKQKINSNGIQLLKLSLKDNNGLKRVLKRIKNIQSNIDGKNSVKKAIIQLPHFQSVWPMCTTVVLHHHKTTAFLYDDNKSSFIISHTPLFSPQPNIK